MADMIRSTQLATEVISATPAAAVFSTFTALEIIVSRFIVSEAITLTAGATVVVSGVKLHTATASANATATVALTGDLLPTLSGWGIPIS